MGICIEIYKYRDNGFAAYKWLIAFKTLRNVFVYEIGLRLIGTILELLKLWS